MPSPTAPRAPGRGPSPGASPGPASREAPANAFSLDVEEAFQVLNFRDGISPDDWDRQESRVSGNTRVILDLLDEAGARGTFFVLGWVAERQRDLIREISARGHEVASHGWSHTPLDRLTREAFRTELRRSKALLEDLAGRPVAGFRAPSFSITRSTWWALDELLEAGYSYDSSVFPVRHPDYGVPDAPRGIHQARTPAGGVITEFPLTVASFAGLTVPVAGGGYFRLLPYAITAWGLRQAAREGRPAVFYLHPWEVDAGQPDLRAHATRLGAFRHYTGLARTLPRLRRLLGEFRFGTCAEVIASRAAVLASA